MKGDRNKREENEDEDTRDSFRKGSLVTDGDWRDQMASAWAMSKKEGHLFRGKMAWLRMEHQKWRNRVRSKFRNAEEV